MRPHCRHPVIYPPQEAIHGFSKLAEPAWPVAGKLMLRRIATVTMLDWLSPAQPNRFQCATPDALIELAWKSTGTPAGSSGGSSELGDDPPLE